jgi:toxin FitB
VTVHGCDEVAEEFHRLKRERGGNALIAAMQASPYRDIELESIGSVTFAEIRLGIELVPDAGRRTGLNDCLAHKVRPMLEERVLPVTEGIMFKMKGPIFGAQ